VIAIPREFGDITTGWCQAQLAGSFDDAVVAVGVTPLGPGRFGTTARLRLTWAAGRGPATMIVKLASSSPRTRRAARLFRTYEVETGFYRDVARRLRVHVARCYCCAYEPADGSYCLLLEDITGAAHGDQLAGCRAGQAQAALAELARLHAGTLGESDIARLPWVLGRSPAITSREAAAMALRWSHQFVTHLSGSLRGDVPRALGLLSAAAGSYGGRAEAGLALLHGDFRSDNLMFRAGQAVVLDWQTAGTGPALADVSYFVGTSVADSDRAGRHAAYLDYYLARLRAEGAVLDPDGCWHDYRAYALGGLIMAIVGWALVERTPRGDGMFAAMANRAASHVLELTGEAR
jgi:phosphotransferase family enzyme